MRTSAFSIGCLLVASLAVAQTPSSPVAGAWEGTLEAPGVKLRMGVAVTVQPDGGLSATMDSPDQGAFGLPLSGVTFANRVLRFSLAAARGRFEGQLNDAGTEIAGTWTQGMPLPLVLRKVEKLTRPNRPQEPKPPFPYRSEDVAIVNAAGKAVLAGTLTLPSGAGRFPAAVLITGSGPQNRDEELMGHKPFLVLADYLTRHGIAVLRYDDRGVGKSSGNFAVATSEDFAGDALAAWQVLSARPEIDPRRVGLIGHSEGALIAPMLAARTPGVAFVVMLAGPGVAGDEIMLRQSTSILKASGAPDAAVAANVELQKQVFAILREETDPARITERLNAIPAPAGRPDAKAALVQQSLSPWLRFFVRYDPVPALTKVACPVLALNGELDTQVAADQNLPIIEAALKRGGNADVTVTRLPGMNHLLQTCKTGLPAEYVKIEETMSPAALDTIATWIQKRTGLAK
jgi:pimeloyl-ACP methyl ester carboxylesterase